MNIEKENFVLFEVCRRVRQTSENANCHRFRTGLIVIECAASLLLRFSILDRDFHHVRIFSSSRAYRVDVGTRSSCARPDVGEATKSLR